MVRSHGHRTLGYWLHTQRAQDLITAYVCVLPWVVGFVSFTLGPMAYSLGLSFFEADMLTRSYFVGLGNYSALFTDKLFLQSLKVTATYAFLSVPLCSAASILVALLLNAKIIGLGIWRTIYYLPSVISGVAVAMLWMQVFNPRMGLINGVLSLVGVKGPQWIFSATWALPSLIIMSLWGAGGAMLLYLAGLQGIPTHLYEAARLDGATGVGSFLYITVPMLTPTIFFNLVIGLINGFQFFSESYIMTGGGPNNATLTMVLFLFRKAFQQTRFGYASAVAWVLFAIVVTFTVLLVRSSDRWVYYEGELRR